MGVGQQEETAVQKSAAQLKNEKRREKKKELKEASESTRIVRYRLATTHLINP